ncbi:cation:proton antiporter, partial [Pseudomonas oryzihabitans]|uniref:cation:proton antiporter n=1 Tax=Pseudomonas oryzihabitans TaxID=47885 RepID=UPI0028A2CCC2
MLELAAIILFITAGLAFLNRRYVGLPSAIGVMAIALALSLACIGLDWLGYPLVRNYEQNLLSSIDFSELLMQGMLSVLLFAGALHIDLSELRAFRWQVSLLAVVGTTISTLVVGFALFYLLSFTHVSLSLIHCLIFGALISPTDPIAVMGILRTAGAPKNTELVIAGESLFNDGVGVVLFSVLLATLVNDEPITLTSTLEIFAHEAGGGILLGLIAGYLAFVMLRSIDSYPEEILITLATVLGGYTLANHLGVSGPLAMVVAGLIIGNHGRALAMSDTTRKRIDAFWEALDEILNAVLFVLIGLEIILIDLAPPLLLGGVLVAVLTLLARLVTVGLPVRLLGRK